MAAYVYASCGVRESTTDVVFGGHCLIAENGTLLAESRALPARRRRCWSPTSISTACAPTASAPTASATPQLYVGARAATSSASPFALDAGEPPPTDLRRAVDAHPFVPHGEEQLRERCEEIFHTQVAGLAKRLEHIGKPPVAIGISGGLDSTLALLVACKTMDALACRAQRILRLHHARLRHHAAARATTPAP